LTVVEILLHQVGHGRFGAGLILFGQLLVAGFAAVQAGSMVTP
jgi:hypothetical protein